MEQVNIKKKALIVDDEPNVRRLLHTILSKNFEVIEGEDGKQAIEIANAQKPDVILMDMMMPKMDGIKACALLKADKRFSKIPVIMLTAGAQKSAEDLSRQIGAEGFIYKPLVIKDLMHKIQELIP